MVKTSIPGIDPEDLSINVSGDTLTIVGESKADKEIKEANYIYRELRYGVFSRSIAIPISVEPDYAEAELVDGVLTLMLPKADEPKPRAIEVKTR